MPRPVALVWFEGTLAEKANYLHGDLGVPITGMVAASRKLSETHDVIILSSFAQTVNGRKRVTLWLQTNGFAYAGVWQGVGVPAHDVRYDSSALLLEK